MHSLKNIRILKKKTFFYDNNWIAKHNNADARSKDTKGGDKAVLPELLSGAPGIPVLHKLVPQQAKQSI